MKKLVLLISAVAIFAGCVERMTIAGGPREFTAVSADMDIATRTHILSPNPSSDPVNPAGRVVNWNFWDQVAVYDTEKHLFESVGEGGTVKIKGSINEDFTGTFYALYPYSACLGFSRGVFNSQIPSNQYVASGEHWDPNAPVVVGSCGYEEDLIKFYNANSLIELYLPAQASSISIMAYGTESVIAGDINVIVSPLSVTSGEYKYNIVTLTGSLAADTPYYIATTPSTLPGGFRVNVVYDEPFTINGTTYSAGLHYYKNNSTSAAFTRDRITVIDLLGIPPTTIDGAGALLVDPHLPMGSYIFRSEDGSVDLTVDHNGADKAFWMQFKVYDYDRTTLITNASLEGYQINHSGWKKERVSSDSEPPCYRLKLAGTGVYDNAYLRYDPVLQGFVMVRDVSEATVFYIYVVN